MKKLIVMMLSSVALLSTSCSKGEQDIEASASSQTQSVAPKVAGNLVLDLMGGYELSAEQVRALSYDGLDRDGKTILSDGAQDWSSTLFIRNESGTVQFTADMTWVADARQGTKFKLNSPKGSDGHTRLVLKNGGGATLPAKGETWYISGILGGGTLASDGKSISFNNKEAETKASNKANIPYAFGWTPFVVGDVDAPAKVIVHFKPLGVQLVVKADQWEGKLIPKPEYYPKARIISNTLTQDGYFDFKLGDKPTEGALPQFVYGKTVDKGSVDTLKAQLGIHGELLSAMIWAMPKEGAVAPSDPKTRPCIQGYIADERGTTTEHGLRNESKGGFKSGQTYEIKLSIFRPRLPLELFAELNMSEDHQNFAKAQTMYGDKPGTDLTDGSLDEYINRAEALRPANPNNYISGRRLKDKNWQFPKHWKLPHSSEWAAAFYMDTYELKTQKFGKLEPAPQWLPMSVMNVRPKTHIDPTLWTIPLVSASGTEERSPAVFDQARGKRTTSIATGRELPTVKLFYMLRFKDPGYNNVFLTAYRYEYVYSADKPDEAYMKVSARYLGAAGAHETLATISDEDFWNNNNSDDVVRIFPLTGQITSRDGFVQIDYMECFHPISADAHSFHPRFWGDPIRNALINIDHISTLSRGTVRLMRTHCCDLDDEKYQH